MGELPGHSRDLTKIDPERLSVRDRILRTAMILFNDTGVHQTGIDKIIADSRVAKMSFYNHFPSKQNLITAYLGEKGRLRMESFRRHTHQKHKDPVKKALGIFDSLAEWIEEKNFRGCPFVKGLSDFGSAPGSEPQIEVARYFAEVETFVSDLLKEAVSPATAKSALPQFMTLIVGTIVMGVATGDAKIAIANKKLAQQLLNG